MKIKQVLLISFFVFLVSATPIFFLGNTKNYTEQETNCYDSNENLIKDSVCIEKVYDNAFLREVTLVFCIPFAFISFLMLVISLVFFIIGKGNDEVFD